MQSGRDSRDGVYRSRDSLDSFQGYGSRRSMFPTLLGGRDPFDDPFFSCPLGSMFESSKEPTFEHPDDVVDDRNELEKVEGEHSQGRNFPVQACRVTYGGVDGPYYTSTRTRRAGGDGVVLEENKEADRTTGQATHRISRGLHDKGHSVTRKLKSDGKVDMLQTLHNLKEDEIPGFEEAWTGNAKGHLHGWRGEFNMHGNAGSGSRHHKGNTFWGAGLLPSAEHVHSARGNGSDNATRATSDGRTKRVVRINIG